MTGGKGVRVHHFKIWNRLSEIWEQHACRRERLEKGMTPAEAAFLKRVSIDGGRLTTRWALEFREGNPRQGGRIAESEASLHHRPQRNY